VKAKPMLNYALSHFDGLDSATLLISARHLEYMARVLRKRARKSAGFVPVVVPPPEPRKLAK
jgi:hypothetical protein